MQNIRPKAITINHFRRRVVVYIRCAVYSSTSVDQQIAQRDFAIDCGWPIDAINIIDDEGVSGLNGNRPGYQRLIQLIEAEQVGLVLVSDLARLSRSSAELERFLVLCQSTNTFVAANGTIVTPDVHNQR